MEQTQNQQSGNVPPTEHRVELQELLTPAQPSYASTVEDIARIYLASFPDEERIPPEQLFALGAGRRMIVGMNPATGSTVGFCTLLPIPDHAAFLVEYLATDPMVRSSGLGSRLLNQSAETAHQSGAAHLFMELEHPDHTCSPQDAVRRVAFYRRNGCARVAWLDEYVVPDLGNPERVIPMLLFVKDLTESPAPYEPRALFEALYRAIYRDAGATLLPGLLAAVRSDRAQ